MGPNVQQFAVDRKTFILLDPYMKCKRLRLFILWLVFMHIARLLYNSQVLVNKELT